MNVNLTFDLADERDYRLWAKIAAVLSGSPQEAAPQAAPVEQPTRPKLVPQPSVAPVAPPVVAAPAPATAPPVSTAPIVTPPPQQAAPATVAPNGAAVPTVQDLREALGALGAVSSAGEAADFLRLQLGSPNLSSIPEDKRGWALGMLKQETANRQAMA